MTGALWAVGLGGGCIDSHVNVDISFRPCGGGLLGPCSPRTLNPSSYPVSDGKSCLHRSPLDTFAWEIAVFVSWGWWQTHAHTHTSLSVPQELSLFLCDGVFHVAKRLFVSVLQGENPLCRKPHMEARANGKTGLHVTVCACVRVVIIYTLMRCLFALQARIIPSTTRQEGQSPGPSKHNRQVLQVTPLGRRFWFSWKAWEKQTSVAMRRTMRPD